MKPHNSTPTPLKIVAFIFIAFGILTFANALLALVFLSQDGLSPLQITIAIGVKILCPSIIFVGIGLLRLSPKSRNLALAAVWLVMGMIACLLILVAFTPDSNYQWKGQSLETFPPLPSFLLGATVFALSYWKYCVLTHSRTRRLFDPLDY